MSVRTPAGDKGTADRIEADDGGYWVRLVTKQAMLREGECMQNCLRSGAKSMLAGNEETRSDALWSLRKACGTSYALAEVGVLETACQIWHILGPHNNPPSPWAVRQVRHLRALFQAAELDLWADPRMVLVGPDGMTYRPDKAPGDLRAAAEAERIESERRVEERQEAYRREGWPSLRSMPVRYTVLEEVDAAPVTPEEIATQQAAERAWVAGLGLDAPAPQAVTIGMDTQPPQGDLGPSDAIVYRVPEIGPGSFAAYVEHTLRSVAASVDLPYEEFTRGWREISESSERARLAQRIRDRGLIITTPPMERASALRAFRDRRQERHRLLNPGDRS